MEKINEWFKFAFPWIWRDTPTSPTTTPLNGAVDVEKGDGAIVDVTSTIKHAKQTNTRITENLKHQRNLQASQASSLMAAQAAAMGLPAESATAIGNFAASTVAKSFSFAQAAAVHRSDTSANQWTIPLASTS